MEHYSITQYPTIGRRKNNAGYSKPPKLLFLVPMHITFESYVSPYKNGRETVRKDGKLYNSLPTDIPLGPISMSAYLKQFIDIDVRLVDFNVELNHTTEFPYENFADYCIDFLKKIDFSPDIVGVSSLFSPSLLNFIACGEVAKSLWPDALIIGGGNIPSNSYKTLYNEMDCDYFDAFCFGEGEKPIRDLLLASDKNKYLYESKSWITKEKVQSNESFKPEHDFISNLDEIPFYDYDLIDIKRTHFNKVLQYSPPMTLPAVFSDDGIGGFHIMTSRGCPFMCTFCAAHKTHGRTMRYHSVERVESDLKQLISKYGASQVIFQDDHLMGDTERVYRLLKVIKKLGLSSLYQNGLTLYALDRPMLEAFYDAGVRQLVLPVESGSEKVLKEQMKKPLKFRISERVASDCRDLGIYTKTNILIGMPGETKADMEEARVNLRKIKTNWFSIACASPLVGSEMHDLASEKGFISGEILGADYHKAVINTDDFSSDYIQHMQYLMNLELNFFYNQDMAVGNFKNALIGFSNVLLLREDHAIAHYYSAICHKALSDFSKYKIFKAKFEKFSQSDFWSPWVRELNLPDLGSKEQVSNDKEHSKKNYQEPLHIHARETLVR